MTNSLFFDDDGLSAFLWIGKENLLTMLYPGQVVIPRQVYVEFSAPTIPQLKSRIDVLLSNNQISIADIQVGTEIFDLYYQLAVEPKNGYKIIGKGEAAAIVLTKFYDGILASNNLSDITYYIKEFNLKHITTAEILNEAFERGYISEIDGNKLWSAMISRRRLLGYKSFSDYLLTLK